VDVVFFFSHSAAAAEWNALVWSIVVLVFSFYCLGFILMCLFFVFLMSSFLMASCVFFLLLALLLTSTSRLSFFFLCNGERLYAVSNISLFGPMYTHTVEFGEGSG
jgi:hypothetical protein